VAARAGATWYSEAQRPDSGGGFAQLIVSRSLREYLWLSSGLYYHSNATNENRLDQNLQRPSGQAYALAIPVALEVRLQTFLAWDAEASFNVAGYHAKYPVLSTAFKIISNRHTFALIMSNSQYITADGLVANTDRGVHDLIVDFLLGTGLGLGTLLARPAAVARAEGGKVAIPSGQAGLLKSVGGSIALKVKGKLLLLVRDSPTSVRAFNPRVHPPAVRGGIQRGRQQDQVPLSRLAVRPRRACRARARVAAARTLPRGAGGRPGHRDPVGRPCDAWRSSFGWWRPGCGIRCGCAVDPAPSGGTDRRCPDGGSGRS
jgi:hypothetical protein